MKTSLTRAARKVRTQLTTKIAYRPHGRSRLFLSLGGFILVFGMVGGYPLLFSDHAAAASYSVFKSGVAGKCLDDANGGNTNGTIVDIWDCGGTTSQYWTVNSDGTIESSSGLCLDNWQNKNANNNPVKLYTCNSTQGAEQWQQSNGELVNPDTGKCLDDPASNTTNGHPLDIYTCVSTAKNEQWTNTTHNVNPGPTCTATGGVAGTDTSTASTTDPTNLQVYTGGTNVALVWDMPTNPVKDIQVFRNGTQIATVTPDTTPDALQNAEIGKEYDDANITQCQTYQYQVRAEYASGVVSDLTPAITVTPPSDTTAAPTVTISDTSYPTLDTYMQNKIVPLLQTWYPKDSDELAYPAYTPPTNITIKFVEGLSGDGGGYCDTTVSGTTSTITCDPDLVQADMVKSDNDVAAVFVHESTHSIQSNASAPGWAIEGGASWDSDFFARQNINNYYPHTGEQLGGYSVGAFFINYIRNTYDASFPRDVNIAAHNGTSTDTVISQDTGGALTTAANAWQATLNAYNSSTNTIKGVGGYCTEVQNSTVADGTALVLDTCNKVNNNAVTNVTFKSAITGSNVCLDDYAAEGSGTQLDIWDCNNTNELWNENADGTIESVESNTCISNYQQRNVNNNPVILFNCIPTNASEQWQLNSSNELVNPQTGKCLDDPASHTTDGTKQDLYTCVSTAKNEQWIPTGGTTLTGDFAQQWALTYHSTSKTGVFEITSPNLGNLTGTPYCMDVSGSGTADGTVVQYWQCDQTSAQYWTKGANGTIVNVNSGKCLSTVGGGSTIGTGLVIRTCDGGADQTWTTPS